MLIVNNVANVSKIIYDNLKNRKEKVEFVQPVTSLQTKSKLKILFNRFTFLFKLYKKAKNHELLHIHYAFLGIYGILLNKNYVLHCHGTDIRSNLYNKYRLITYYSLRYAKVIFYTTPDLEEHIPKEFKSKAFFLPNPILIDNFKPSSDKKSTKKKVFFISKIDKTKGADKFQKLIDYFENDDKVSEIAMFNYGNIGSDISFKGKRIKYLGKIKYEDMPQIINQYDIIIGQLSLGSVGMSELEALSCGKCVASYFKYKEHYSSPIPMINSNSIDQLIEEIDKYLTDDELRNKIGIEARQWVIENHSVETIVNKFIDKLNLFNLKIN